LVQKRQSKYIESKHGYFYYCRRVPKRVLQHYRLDRIRTSLHTRHPEIARRRAQKISFELEREWEVLTFSALGNWANKFRQDYSPALTTALVSPSESISNSPLLTEAAEYYLSQKGTNRPEEFYGSVRRAVRYIEESVGIHPINAYNRELANAFRDYLIQDRGLSTASAKRILTTIKAIVTFTAREKDLPTVSAFSAIHFAEPNKGSILRKPIPVTHIRKVQAECLAIADDPRLTIALISDTGLRLAEALGLQASDVVLTDNPHIIVKPHPWRRLKTAESERIVPLVGASLSAAKVLKSRSADPASPLIPKFCDGKSTKANSASGALNKWLKPRVPEGCVVHSFRHSLRDRLRNVECPTELIDELGGWAKASVGQHYGEGHSIEMKSQWMLKISED
jgi:integrase